MTKKIIYYNKYYNKQVVKGNFKWVPTYNGMKTIKKNNECIIKDILKEFIGNDPASIVINILNDFACQIDLDLYSDWEKDMGTEFANERWNWYIKTFLNEGEIWFEKYLPPTPSNSSYSDSFCIGEPCFKF